MAEVIKMPRMSDTMTEGKIVAWHKKVGDKVKPGDLLAEVETDKATMELESYNEGVLLYIGIEAGNVVPVEGVIAVIGKAGEDYKAALGSGDTKPQAPAASDKPQESKAQVANQPAPQSANPQISESANQTATATKPAVDEKALGVTVIRMPLLSDTMTEGKIVTWNKKVGDKIKSDDNIADVETDKATMEIIPYAEGTLLYIGVEAGNAAKVNDVIAIIGKPGTDVTALVESFKSGVPQVAPAKKEEVKPQENKTQAANQPAPQSANPQISESANQQPTTNGRLKASPLAKKLAAEKGVDLKTVHGSGDGGRIIKADVDSYKQSSGVSRQASDNRSPVISTEEGYTDIPNSQMRKTIARRLGESMYTAPHFYLTMEFNMDNVMSVRAQLNTVSPVKISFQDIMIKACALSLRKHPAVNASWMGDNIRQWHHIHIGSAVAVEDGLIVPVFKFADQKTLPQIATEANELYDKARNKKLQPQEFSGNTFTISNLGMMDIEEFTAIINPPDSCILAVGKIKEVVVRKGEGFGVTNVMKVTLSCDHRAVDGAVGSAFLQTLKKFIENPVTMLI